MATELQIQNHPHATPASNMWVKMMRSASYEGMESPYAAKEMAKKTVIDKKAIDKPKKQCLCAPTTHAGSFKCRLHRASSTQKSSASSESISGGNKNFNCRKITQCKNVDGRPQLSRFGKAAAAAAPDQPAIPITADQC